MEKYRRARIITIIVLMVVMAGLTIGFAAFTSVLTISSTATVKPDESSFSVLFSSSGTSQATAQITPTVSGATGDKATISGTTISGLKANFTEPGQSVTYTFWAHNAGSYIAYLRNITYGTTTGGSSFKYCTPGTNATSDLVTAACEDISVSISVGNTSITDTANTFAHPLAVNDYEQVVVTITYASDGDRADGAFDIAFGDITLNYSSVDAGQITFTIDGTSHQAIEGMTWKDWVNSEYNVDGYIYLPVVSAAGGCSFFGCPTEAIGTPDSTAEAGTGIGYCDEDVTSWCDKVAVKGDALIINDYAYFLAFWSD